MNKTELESKHLAELHALAADAGVERYRMLPRAELIEKLAGGAPKAAARPSGPQPKREQGQGRPKRDRRERKPRQPRPERREPEAEEKPEPRREEPRRDRVATEQAATPPPGRPKRKRRRRRWGRRRKGVRVHDLLLPAAPGRQAIVYAESRAGCTALLREVAAELAGASGGPEPIALLIDPSPEELAEWRRDAPQAEIVAAGKAHHAGDALAQARSRTGAGEAVIVLVDSLSRFAEAFAGVDEARELFDAGLDASSASSGSLTVVAAVERPS